MSELHDHIRQQADAAELLARIIDTLNIAIDLPDRRDFMLRLIEEAQEIGHSLADNLGWDMLPKGGAE
ncbi:hypothetical protein [Gemmobacter nectariphilus]|uniref:hypothetical protein n=1 Tax=Gemmobacter nectariphilus TaxID=220343 RepID=UPI000410C2F7|nr:hypothetical protein [Gemmobacter nectariphilus]